jgi:hypothetical protein
MRIVASGWSDVGGDLNTQTPLPVMMISSEMIVPNVILFMITARMSG